VSAGEEVSVSAADSRSDLIDRDALRADRAVSSLERRLEQLADSHPASPRYGRDSRAPEADARPLTDTEHAEHVADVRSRLDDAREAGLATDHQFTVDAKRRIWSDQRDALHDEIVADLYARSSEVPRDHDAILAGGLPGSGKTTVLTEHAGIDLERYLMINPDSVKEEMARRGLIPEVEGLSPMEASDLVHEESSRIAKRLAHRAQGDGMNVIWDVTMSDEQSTVGRLESLRLAGYTRVEAIFVDIPVEVSARRADARHREGHDDYRMSIGQGGRYVPPELIMNQAVPDWGSQNRQTFENLKRRFDDWSRYDNSVDGRAPTVAETSKNAHLQERIDQ
jgi:predicted kinase